MPDSIATAVPAHVERPPPPRIAGLDGLRGLCALYVMMFHVWAFTYYGFPRTRSPHWLYWLGYGRLAVVLFLILSGFSLAYSAAARGWHLGPIRDFARRRARRILPPYYAALAFSLAIAWLIVKQPHSAPPTTESVVVYGLLLQDLISAPTPNGAFWSIGVEALLYVLFPALIALTRRAGVWLMLACATAPVLLGAVLLYDGAPPEGDYRLAPHLLPVFAAGIAAAGIATAPDRIRRLPWFTLASAAAVPAAALLLHQGAHWTVTHYFWVDLAVTPALTLLVVALATAQPPPLIRLLTTRPLERLGAFSYSLYLIHVPIVFALSERLVVPAFGHGSRAFAATTLTATPLALLTAFFFAKLLERPPQTKRAPRREHDPRRACPPQGA